MPARSKLRSGAEEPAAHPPAPFGGMASWEQGDGRVTEAAHDFNNILSVILSCAAELDSYELGDEAVARVGEIDAAARRGADLVRELVGGPDRQGHPEGSPLAPGPAIEGLRPLLERTLGPGVALEVRCGRGVPRVGCATAALERALLNLASNARDAMPAGGRVSLRLSRTEVGAGDSALAPGSYALVTFSDSGCGMGPHELRRAASRGFTTKGPAGTGLGLATVSALARAADGEMRIASAPGAGTSVALFLRGLAADGTPLALGRRS